MNLCARHPWLRIPVLAGVALIGVAVTPALVDATPPDAPLAAPDYSFDLQSPTVIREFVRAGDVLYRGMTRPVPALRAQALGLTPADDIDALSGPNADVRPPDILGLLFSVDHTTVGNAAPNPLMVLLGHPYNVADQAERGHAAGDQFIVIDLFRRDGPVQQLSAEENNVLVRNNFDEGGTDFSAWPPTHASSTLEGSHPQDRVDAMGLLPRREADGRIQRLYFSLTGDSPSLGELSGDEPSGANIFFATAAPIRGACCLQNGQCIPLPASVCAQEGGMWQGPDSPCELCEIELGACCIGNHECVEVARFQCLALNGHFFQEASCEQFDCMAQARGACCLGPGFCLNNVSAVECGAAGGEFSEWTGCADTTCFDLVIGSCCTDNGCINLVDDVICHGLGGTFFPGQGCAQTDCGLRGACCLPEMCAEGATRQQCDHAGGVFHEGLRCHEVVCKLPPLPLERDDGSGEFRPDTSLRVTARIEGGDPGHDVKTTVPCEPAAACCFAGACVVTDSVECGDAGGVWIEGYDNCVVCATRGACCLPSGNCVQTRPANCDNADGRWLGPGVPCGSCAGDANAGEVWRFASFETLGLAAEDDLDAMIVFDDNENGVFDETDTVLFSLARGSPSLLTIPNASPQGAAADIFVAHAGEPPALFARARALGLGAEPDNIDALNLVIEPGSDHGIRRCDLE